MTGLTVNSMRYSDFTPNARAHGSMQKTKSTNQRQDTQINKTLQGVLVNTYIKDDKSATSDMDAICNNLVIPDKFETHPALQSMPVPPSEITKRHSLLRNALPYVASALAATGMALAISNSYAKSQKLLKPGNVPTGAKLPAVGKNINLRSEEYFAVYMAISEPKARNILALGAVFAMSALTFAGKTLLDGVKSIWLKKKEADIKKNFEENVIDIETQSFAGKLDVIRKELVEKSNYFKEKLETAPSEEANKQTGNQPLTQEHANLSRPSFTMQNSVQNKGVFRQFMAFRGEGDVQTNAQSQNDVNSKTQPLQNEVNPENSAPVAQKESNPIKNFYNKIKNSQVALGVVTALTLGIMFLGGRKVFSNISKGAKIKEETVNLNNEKIRNSLNEAVENFLNSPDDNAKEGVLQSIKEKLLSLMAEPDEVFSTIKKAGLDGDEAKKIADEVNEAISEMKFGKKFYVQADPAMGGKEGTQFYIYIDQAKGYIYDVITHPENKFARYLFTAITATGACGYAMKEALDAMKESTVMRENSNTELELQQRLVDTEIRNFKSKKESAIAPMMQEFDAKLLEGKSKEELKIMAENILLEIKNGPPFVYA